MRPTRFGVQAGLFYLVMLAAFFAAPYSNLFFGLLGFLTLAGLSGVLGARRNLADVTARLDALPPVPSGAVQTLRVKATAPRRVRFQLDARLTLEGGAELTGRLDVLDGQAALAVTSPALQRGCYAVTGAWLESSHPLGLVRARRALDAPSELVVYPAPRELEQGRRSAEALDELLGDGLCGAGDLQPSGLRDHQDGDELRAVHWRASARRGALVVQEWEGASGGGLEVLLDRRCAPEALEQALATLSALAHLARTNKETLRVHSQELSTTFGDGHQPWHGLLRFLAAAQPLQPDGPAPPSVSPSVARLPRAVSRV